MRLSQKCQLVEGVKRAAIYDLESGRVYSLNEIAKDIVKGQSNDQSFWQQLLEMGLAEVDDKKEIFSFDDTESKVSLEFMWLELTNDCNLRCIHCYAPNENQPKSGSLGSVVWKRIIKEGRDLGCQKLQLTGGEVFKYRGVLDLADFTKETGYGFVEIFTNATLLSTEGVKIIKKLGLNVAVSLYSDEPSIHDKITQKSGSFKRTYRGLQLLKSFAVPTRVAMVVMRQNESAVAETQRLVQGLGLKFVKIDIIRPTGRGCNHDLLPAKETITKWGLMKEANFWTSKEEFIRAHHWNGCWAGKIAITSFGEVIPCIFARDYIVGNILKAELRGIVFSRGLQRFWRVTKDDVRVCDVCEYRYACRDCRPLAVVKGGDLKSKYPRCGYDPFK